MQNNEYSSVEKINPTLSSDRLLYEILDEEQHETVRIYTDEDDTHYIIREIIEPTQKYIETVSYDTIDTYTSYEIPNTLTTSLQVTEDEITTTSNEFYTWIEQETENYLCGNQTQLNTNTINFATQNRIFITVTDELITKIAQMLGINSLSKPDKQILEAVLPTEILVEIDYRNNSF